MYYGLWPLKSLYMSFLRDVGKSDDPPQFRPRFLVFNRSWPSLPASAWTWRQSAPILSSECSSLCPFGSPTSDAPPPFFFPFLSFRAALSGTFPYGSLCLNLDPWPFSISCAPDFFFFLVLFPFLFWPRAVKNLSRLYTWCVEIFSPRREDPIPVPLRLEGHDFFWPLCF